MNGEQSPAARRTEMERQITIALAGLLTAGVVWMASSVSETTAVLAALRVQIEALREQIVELKEGGRFAFPAAEARREFNRVDTRLADLETRLRRVEQGGAGGRP